MTESLEDVPAFDPKKGALVGSNGEDYVIISAEALRRIERHEAMMFGSGSSVIWYNSGKSVGKVDGARLAPWLQKMDIMEFASRVRDLYSREGWGFIEFGVVNLNSGEFHFTVRNSPLVRRVTAKEPRCWFVKGFVEGLVSEILGTEVTATETDCQAVNGDHCSFKLSWEASRRL